MIMSSHCVCVSVRLCVCVYVCVFVTIIMTIIIRLSWVCIIFSFWTAFVFVTILCMFWVFVYLWTGFRFIFCSCWHPPSSSSQALTTKPWEYGMLQRSSRLQSWKVTRTTWDQLRSTRAGSTWRQVRLPDNDIESYECERDWEYLHRLWWY